MRYLVLGAKGMLGNEMVDFLKEKKEEIIIFNKKITKKNWTDLISKMMQSDFVFFLAANVGGDGTDFMNESEKSFNFISSNIDLMSEVFDCLHFTKRPFIFASNHIVNDISSIHANIKKIGERYTESLGGLSVRFWNLYGFQKNEKRFNVISNFIKQGLDNKKSIYCQTDGEEKRQFLYVKDCCEALYLLSKLFDNIKKTHNKNYIDVTSFQWNTVGEVLEIVANQLECFCGVSTIKAKPRICYEPDSVILNHWRPKYRLEEGIKDLIKRYKNGN